MNSNPSVRIGLITDLHFAENHERFSTSNAKLAEAASAFNVQSVDFAVELGDLINSGNSFETELSYLIDIEKTFAQCQAPRHYVFGNHCVERLTKQQFIEHTAATAPHYSFDVASFHFIVLDGCYRSDGTPYGGGEHEWEDSMIPDDELAWLASDLATTSSKTIVFTHQRLDDDPPYGLRNAQAVRDALDDSGQVIAVFQGHAHVNDHNEINDTHYITLAPAVANPDEGTAFGILDLYDDRSLSLKGHGRQNTIQT